MPFNGQGFNYQKHEADDELHSIAMRVFGTDDGIRPKFPRRGEEIQEAMKQAYDLGKSRVNSRVV